MKLNDLDKLFKAKYGKKLSNSDIQFLELRATSKDGEKMKIELSREWHLYKSQLNMVYGGFNRADLSLDPLSDKDKGFEKAIDYSKPVYIRFTDTGNKDKEYSINVRTGDIQKRGTTTFETKMAWERGKFK